MRKWLHYFRWQAQMQVVDHEEWVAYIESLHPTEQVTYYWSQQKLAKQIAALDASIAAMQRITTDIQAEFFQGKIEDMQVFPYILTEQEVREKWSHSQEEAPHEWAISHCGGHGTATEPSAMD